MLDIFGFEIFKKNGFEQLCINCANEKLQQMFNKHTFMLEEATYESEGIEFRHVDFKDSQPMLDFLGLPASGKSRDGVFVLLDDETLRGSTEDKKFLRKLISKHGDKTKLFSDRTKKKTVRIIRTTHSLLLHGPPHQLRSGCCGLIYQSCSWKVILEYPLRKVLNWSSARSFRRRVCSKCTPLRGLSVCLNA